MPVSGGVRCARYRGVGQANNTRLSGAAHDRMAMAACRLGQIEASAADSARGHHHPDNHLAHLSDSSLEPLRRRLSLGRTLAATSSRIARVRASRPTMSTPEPNISTSSALPAGAMKRTSASSTTMCRPLATSIQDRRSSAIYGSVSHPSRRRTMLEPFSPEVIRNITGRVNTQPLCQLRALFMDGHYAENC